MATTINDNSTRGILHILGGWNVGEFTTELTILIFLVCVITLRILYHQVPPLVKWVPESLVLLVAGVVFGGLLRLYFEHTGKVIDTTWHLTPQLFFHYLLPPIILDSSYVMYNSAMKNNLGGILLYAVIGTLLNFGLLVAILCSVYYAGFIGKPDHNISAQTILMLSSIIIAVDPVAVMAVFQAIGVNQSLYFIVFGESLFNDAVTIVLYTVVTSISGVKTTPVGYYFIATLSFFTISFGGMLIGMVVGVITCFLTRPRSSLGAVIVLVLGYFSYVIADCLEWSGIISMITCGLIQTVYAFHNISRTSVLVVRRLTKLTSDITESVIFLFIGVELLSRDFVWHAGFHCWTMVACLVARTTSVLLLTTIINRAEMVDTKITFPEQVILICGGMRGAVCFCLAVLIEPSYFSSHAEYKRDLIITTALFVICFTVGLMGLTIKPLIYWLKIPMLSVHKLSLFKQVNERVVGELMYVIEVIAGTRGRNVIRDVCENIDQRYIRPVLQRDPQTHEQKFVELYERIALRLHYAMVQPAKSELYLNQIGRVNQVYTPGGPSGSHTISIPYQNVMKASQTDESARPYILDQESHEADRSSQPYVKGLCRNRCCHMLLCNKYKDDNSMATDVENVSYITADTKTITDMAYALRSKRPGPQTSYDHYGAEFADTFVDMLVSKSMIASDNALIQPNIIIAHPNRTIYGHRAHENSPFVRQTATRTGRQRCCVYPYCCSPVRRDSSLMSYESFPFYQSSDVAYSMYTSPEQSAKLSLCDTELHLALNQEEQEYRTSDTRSRRFSSLLLKLPMFETVEIDNDIQNPSAESQRDATAMQPQQNGQHQMVENNQPTVDETPVSTRVAIGEPPRAISFVRRSQKRAPPKAKSK